jgi:hypothetical protein
MAAHLFVVTLKKTTAQTQALNQRNIILHWISGINSITAFHEPYCTCELFCSNRILICRGAFPIVSSPAARPRKVELRA